MKVMIGRINIEALTGLLSDRGFSTVISYYSKEEAIRTSGLFSCSRNNIRDRHDAQRIRVLGTPIDKASSFLFTVIRASKESRPK